MSADITTADTTGHAAPAVAGHGHDAHDDHGHAPVESGQVAGVARVEQRTGFTAMEWGKALVYVISYAAVFAGTAALLSGVVALFHMLMKFLLGDAQGAVWGNAIGTVLALVMVFVMVVATLLTMGERKWSALMQDRIGPNRARLPIPGLSDKPLMGLPHILSDVFKMLSKEEVVPALGNKIIFHLAPAIAFAPAFVLFAVVPVGPSFSFLGQQITMQVASIDQGLLYVFAAASIAVLGTSLAGWASNNKYALLGGIRASAQMISYEVTLGLTLVGLMIVYQTVRLDSMTVQQGELLWGFVPAWGVLFQPLAIIAYLAAASAEIKRAPFDNPEGESEIVGYYIEYSGLKFGIFMIAEFVEVVVFAGMFSALFFGGYHLPWGEEWIGAKLGGTALGLIQVATFITKTIFFCWLSLAIRWTFPRFRYDQVMDLGWKYLLPLSLLNVVITGLATLWGGKEGAALAGLAQLALIGVYVIGGYNNRRQGDETALKPLVTEPVAVAHH